MSVFEIARWALILTGFTASLTFIVVWTPVLLRLKGVPRWEIADQVGWVYASFLLLLVGMPAYGTSSPEPSPDPLVNVYQLGFYFLLDVLILTRSWRWSKMLVWFRLQRRKELLEHYGRRDHTDGR